MERWRSFFSKAGEDVWTIIEQAILLAAHDHPREFKEKRCDIAETLFATHHNQGETDATRLSASVITNCINRTDISEARDHEDAFAVRTTAQAIHHVGQDHTECCSAQAQDGGIYAYNSIFTIVCRIKEILDDSMQFSNLPSRPHSSAKNSNPDGAVLCGLRKLESLHISVDVLKETEIGKQVNNLRKHPCKEIRLLARGLVRCWKELVDDWVNRAGTSVDLRGEYPASERDNLEDESFLAFCDRDTCISKGRPADMQRHCQCNMADRDSCLEAPEERGSSSRAELAGLGGVGRLEKPHFNVSRTAERIFLQGGINMDAEVLGRKSTNSRSSSVVDRNYGVAKLLTDKSNAEKPYGDHVNQNLPRQMINHQKLNPIERLHSKEKLDTGSKRKPQDGHIQMDNVKRQQVGHGSNSGDFPQAGLIPSKTVGQSSHWNQVRK